MTRSNDFERDFSFADEIEGIGFSAFLKDELTGVEADPEISSIALGPLGALHLEVQQLVRGDQAFMLGREIAALRGVPD